MIMRGKILTISCLLLLSLLTGCKAKSGSSSVASESGAAVDPADAATYTPPAKKLLSADEEIALIREAYDHATTLVKQELPGLGRAWTGNVTGLGPKCNVVQEAYERQVRIYLDAAKVDFKHYIPVSIFDSGWAPSDMSAHIYMGIGTKPKSFSEEPTLYSWTDPWRYGNTAQFQPGTGPNSPNQIIPMY